MSPEPHYIIYTFESESTDQVFAGKETKGNIGASDMYEANVFMVILVEVI